MSVDLLLRRARTPVILQSEVAECGIACLAMVAGHYGLKSDISIWRAAMGQKALGMSANDVTKCATAAGMQSRVLRVDIEALSQLNLPAILHWDLDHFVVLDKVKGDRFTIIDPARGERRLNLREFSDHFTGVMIEIIPAQSFEKVDARSPLRLRDLWERVVGWRGALAKTVVLSLLLQLAGLAVPYFIQLGLDRVVINDDRELLLSLGVAFTALALFSAIVVIVRTRLIVSASALMDFQLSGSLLAHLLRLPMSFFQTRDLGDLISRFMSMRSLREKLTGSLVTAIVDGSFSILIVAAMILYSPLLTAVALVPLLIFIVIQVAAYQSVRRLSEEAITQGAKAQSHLIESLRGIQTLKLFESDADRTNQWRNLFSREANSVLKVGYLGGWIEGAQTALKGVGHVLTIFVGLHLVLNGDITTGVLVAFLAYKGNFEGKLMALIESAVQMRLISVDLQRLADIVKEAPEPLSTDPMQVTEGLIEVHDLSLRYSPGGPRLLKNLNLTVQPGASVAIMGPSGGGKTSLIKIIAGLIPASSGSIVIDGVELSPEKMGSYRRQIATVMQDDQLFAGSIIDNTAFHDPSPDIDKVIQCLKDAAIFDEIDALPMGLHTVIGESGGTLSGGQLQRLIIARAFYKDSKILLMDEATSHLDFAREEVIVNSIAKRQVTRVVVAHRLETALGCDQVFALQDGALHDITEAVKQGGLQACG